MSSQITHAQLCNIHTLVHILGTCALILVVPPFYSLPRTHHVTASYLSPGDKSQGHGRAVRKYTEIKQKWPRRTQSSTYVPGLFVPSYCFIAAQPLTSYLCCPRQPSHHPWNQIRSIPYAPSANFRHQHPPSPTVYSSSVQTI